MKDRLGRVLRTAGGSELALERRRQLIAREVAGILLTGLGCLGLLCRRLQALGEPGDSPG